MNYLRKENGQFATLGEQFSLMEKFMLTFGIALLLVLVFLIIVGYAKNSANVVMEVWASFDNAAYTTWKGLLNAKAEPSKLIQRVSLSSMSIKMGP